MFDSLIASFSTYYGLDWAALAFGLTGCYLVTGKNYWGFLCSFLSCCCGLAVSLISDQFGFVLNNIILMTILMRGFVLWRRDHLAAQAAE